MAKKILVVDDEADICTTLSMFLRTSGYEVMTAQDGAEGLEKARNAKPDLVILDVMMPKIEGFEFCRLLKFDERFKNIKIIMFTAKSQDVDKALGGKVGADDYISKPYDDQELLDKVKKQIGK